MTDDSLSPDDPHAGAHLTGVVIPAEPIVNPRDITDALRKATETLDVAQRQRIRESVFAHIAAFDIDAHGFDTAEYYRVMVEELLHRIAFEEGELH